MAGNEAKEKVSVIMPTYNRSRMIEGSIKSVLAQTYADLELIIVDDGSTDDTERTIREQQDRRVKYFKLPHSGKPAVVRNYGLKNSTGGYIAYCDSDDQYLPDHLEKTVGYLRENPEIKLVYSNREVVNRGGIIRPPADRILTGKFDKEHLEIGTITIFASSVVHYRECLRTVGYWNEADVSARLFEDMEFFIRFSDHFNIGHLTAITVKYFSHPGGLVSEGKRTNLFHAAYLNVFRERVKHLSGAPFRGYYLRIAFIHIIMLGRNKVKLIDFIKQSLIPFYLEMEKIDKNNLELLIVILFFYALLGLPQNMREYLGLIMDKIKANNGAIDFTGRSAELYRQALAAIARAFNSMGLYEEEKYILELTK